MIMYGKLENGFFEIDSGILTYWNTKYEKVFSGKLNEGPEDVLRELQERGAIKQKA